MKKQRSFWIEDKDWNKIQSKITQIGIHGKGKLERFMEKIARERVFFVQGECDFELKVKK